MASGFDKLASKLASSLAAKASMRVASSVLAVAKCPSQSVPHSQPLALISLRISASVSPATTCCLRPANALYIVCRILSLISALTWAAIRIAAAKVAP